MRSRRLRRIVALAALALSTMVPAPVTAQQVTPESIVESQRRLEQIRRERVELREEMTRIRSRVTDLSAELENVQRQVRTSADLLTELDEQLAQREAQIEQNTRDLEFTRDQLAERREALNQRLREIYKRGPLQTVQVLLGADSFSDLINRYRYLLLIAQQDRQLADEVEALERQLVARERALRTFVLQLGAARGERQTEVQQLQDLRAQQGLALDNVRAREQTTAERLDELVAVETQVTGLISNLETRRQAVEAATPGAAAPTPSGVPPSLRGALGWPVDGTVLYRYNAESAAEAGRRGVGIAAPAGALVRAVAGGTVVLAEPFETYGPSVVVSHGDGYYTLYLYLADLLVREGMVIRGAQPIGTVGGGGTAEGPHIELQIRLPGGGAADPLTWLTPPR